MSLLPNQSYANITTPLWVPAGSGGSGTGPTGPTGPAGGPTGPTGVQGPTGPTGVNPGGNAYDVTWTWSGGSPPANPPLDLTSTTLGLSNIQFLKERITRGDGATQSFYNYTETDGSFYMGYALDGSFWLPMNIRGRPVIILGDNTSVLRLTNEQGGTGVLTVDASNNLFWNGTKLN